MILIPLSLSVILALAAIFFWYRQSLENRAIDQFLEGCSKDQGISWESAKAVSEYIRFSFNTDQATFKSLQMRKRPFLREDTGVLLRSKEGLCGEGARVLICCLARLGYDATRVTLFTRWLHPSHTIVSILINDNEEYLIDTLNSQEDFHQHLSETQMSTHDFHLMGHVDNVDDRRTRKRELKASDTSQHQLVTDKYLFFSYDAMPWTKLASVLGLNSRIINLSRPRRMVSSIAERPLTIYAIASSLFSLLLFAIGILGG